ncbi:MAG: methylphosphotriester-DNA--protein-cysteine methyltransferase family protein [Clostridia bacterium]|nr:methylphosphotriester-DNA--protein-cysteine methyltransferase family protein [Clostridia bacterium]MBR1606069.1 methylphosphotriester-DNA--protein-cysteine methyltransferase family protein [Clostridia bacterium]
MTKDEWQILRERDGRYDGQLYCGLIAQKTVCNPSCSRREREVRNVLAFHSLTEAIAQGYRPCAYCRPDRPGWKGAKEELVQSARKYIEGHSADKFSLSAVAGALYVNGSYLLRTFRERTGMTLLSYHNYVRCEKAKELLSRPDLTISQAGEMTGFSSSSHFSRIFKKVTGKTPSAYRRAYFRELDL